MYSKQALGVLCPFLGAYYVKTLQSLLYCRCLYRARTPSETVCSFISSGKSEKPDMYRSFSSFSPQLYPYSLFIRPFRITHLCSPFRFCILHETQGSAENSDEDADDREIGDVDEETDANPPSDIRAE